MIVPCSVAVSLHPPIDVPAVADFRDCDRSLRIVDFINGTVFSAVNSIEPSRSTLKFSRPWRARIVGQRLDRFVNLAKWFGFKGSEFLRGGRHDCNLINDLRR
jgi:hypothetical protein